MKKTLFLSTTLMMAMLLSAPSFAADSNTTQTDNNFRRPPMQREMPKLYDKDGNVLTAPPQKGQKVYDAKGNEITPPQMNKNMRPERPKLYDKDGNELTAPPQKGQKVYDAKGNELPPPPQMGKKMPPKPELNLTDEQKAQMDKIRTESKKKMKPIRKQIHDYQNKIWEINENDSLSPEQKHEKIKPIFEKIQKLQQKSNEIRLADMAQFESLLTKEQKQELEQFKKTHKPPMKPRHHQHPPMMPVFPEQQ